MLSPRRSALPWLLVLAGACDGVSAPPATPTAPVETAERTCEGTPPAFADPWTYGRRAEGDTFIEILDVAATEDQVLACTGTQGLTGWSRDDAVKLAFENVGPKGISHPRFPRCQHLAIDPASKAIAITNRGDEVQPTPFLAVYDPPGRRGTPSLGATWTGTASIEGVAWSGGRLIAAAHDRGVLVFERAGKTLRQVGALEAAKADAWDVEVRKGHAFVANGTGGLLVVDITDPKAPKQVATLALPGSAGDVSLDPKSAIAYLATKNGLAVVDISDPAAPTLRAHVETPGTALMVRPSAPGTVVVADWAEVRAYDVRKPDAPVLRASKRIPTDGDFSRVLALDAAPDGSVYAGEWQGLHTLSLRAEMDAPDVDVEGGSTIRLGRLGTGNAATHTVWLGNRGTRPLSIHGVKTSGPVSVEQPCLEIAPGDSAALALSVTPDGRGPVAASVVLASNDPDEATVALEITANASGLDVGDPAPPLNAIGLDGTTWDSERLRGKVVVLSYFATF